MSKRKVGQSQNEVANALKEDARNTRKKQEKYQSLNTKPTMLKTINPGHKVPDQNGVRQNQYNFMTSDQTNNNYPTEALTMGKWIAKDPRDDRMNNLQRLAQNQKFGSVSAPVEETLDWIQQKQDQIYNQNLYRLGAALIDPDHPETQEKAYAILPQLKKVPEAYITDTVAMQMTLNSILRDGTLKGPEDLQFVMHILDPLTELPTEPLWDLSGVFKDVRSAAEREARNDVPSGIFSPFKYSFTTQEVANQRKINAQLRIKVAIVKRLFPAFRNKTYNEVQAFLVDIIKREDDRGLPREIGYDGNLQTGNFMPGKMRDFGPNQ